MSDPEARDMAAPEVLAVSAAFDIPQVDAAYALATLELDGYAIGPAADPTLICPDPTAHEGVTFTTDSLAAALTAVSGKRPHPEFVAEVIQAAKEAERE